MAKFKKGDYVKYIGQNLGHTTDQIFGRVIHSMSGIGKIGKIYHVMFIAGSTGSKFRHNVSEYLLTGMSDSEMVICRLDNRFDDLFVSNVL